MSETLTTTSTDPSSAWGSYAEGLFQDALQGMVLSRVLLRQLVKSALEDEHWPQTSAHSGQESISSLTKGTERHLAQADVDVLIGILRERYEFRNAVRVSSFLQVHPEVAVLLHEAEKRIRRIFGDSSVRLELLEKPEATALFAVIRTPPPAEAALKKLDRLDDEWFLDHVDESNGLLNFTLEIQ